MNAFKKELDLIKAQLGGDYKSGLGAAGEDLLLAKWLPELTSARAHEWLGQFKSCTLGDLPKGPGVYILLGNHHKYVGISSNIYNRIWQGHLSPLRSFCASTYIVNEIEARAGSLGDVEMLVKRHSKKSTELRAVEEVLTAMCLLRVHMRTEVVGIREDRVLINHLNMLGVAGYRDAIPVVGYCADSGEYLIAESGTAMESAAGVDHGIISSIANGKQSTAQGWTFRHTTENETLSEGLKWDVFEPSGSSDAVVDHVPVNGRFRITWNAGPLTAAAIDVVEKARSSKTPQSGIPGVHYDKTKGCWSGWAYEIVTVDGKSTKRQRTTNRSSDKFECEAKNKAWVAEAPATRLLMTRGSNPRRQRVQGEYVASVVVHEGTDTHA